MNRKATLLTILALAPVAGCGAESDPTTSFSTPERAATPIDEAKSWMLPEGVERRSAHYMMSVRGGEPHEILADVTRYQARDGDPDTVAVIIDVTAGSTATYGFAGEQAVATLQSDGGALALSVDPDGTFRVDGEAHPDVDSAAEAAVLKPAFAAVSIENAAAADLELAITGGTPDAKYLTCEAKGAWHRVLGRKTAPPKPPSSPSSPPPPSPSPPRPDLYIKSFTATQDVSGGGIRYSVNVCNGGAATAWSFMVSVDFLEPWGPASCPGMMNSQATFGGDGPLAPGYCKPVLVYGPGYVPYGSNVAKYATYKSTAYVDSYCAITESNEANNTKSLTYVTK